MSKIVDNLDGVPEDYRSFYVEIAEGDNKGKFQLEDVSSLRNTMTHTKRERDEARAKARQVAAWEKLGKTPEQIQEMLTAAATAEEEAARKRGDTDAILKQKQEGWDSEKATLTAEVDTWRNTAQNTIVETKLSGALAKAEATAEGLDLLPDRLRARVDTKIEDGKVVTRILSEDGKTPMAGSGADGSATFDDLVKDVKKKYPSLFKGTGASGSGASNSNGSGAPSGKPRSKMTTAEKVAYQREHGQAAYLQLPA